MKRAVAVSLLITASAQAGVYSFGGGCASQGAWTQAALQQTQVMAQAIEALKNNPDCKGIESIVGQIKIAQDALKTSPAEENRQDRVESLPSEIQALRTYLNSSTTQREDISKLLMDRTLEGAALATDAAAGASPVVGAAGPGASLIGGAASAANPAIATALALKELQARTSRATKVGLDMADSIMRTLPNFDKCLIGAPNQAMAVISGAVRLAGAFAAADEGVTARLGTSLANLTTMLRDRKFTKVLRKLNESEFWLSMSCLLETTAQNYCSAQDAYELLYYSANQKVDEALKRSESPLEGYYLLVRESPTVAEWLQKLQFGTTPKLSTDAVFKNNVWTNILGMVRAINTVRGAYNEDLLTLSTLTETRAKKNMVFEMVRKLMMMLGAGGGDGLDTPKSVGDNFFTLSVSPEMMPFYLIGLERLPPELTPDPANPGKIIVPWDQWMKADGNYVAQFSDPDTLAQLIGTRLQTIIDGAQEKASAYFRQRLIVDMPNLVNEALTHQSLTVLESLKHIHTYLGKLKVRIAQNDGDPAIIPSIIDTQRRIKKVLDSFEELRKVAKEMALNESDDPALDNKIVASYQKVIEEAYDQFNVLLQRDTFLMVRLNTFVREDYALRIRAREQMSDYQRDLYIVTGRNLLDRIIEVHRLNPADAENDLRAAQVVNKRNLEAFEQIFAESLETAMTDLETAANGRGGTFWEHVKWDVTNNWVRYVGAPVPMTLIPEKRASVIVKAPRDDKFASFAQFKAKLCIQTLAFENKERFAKLCGNTILKSVFDSSPMTEGYPVRLSAVYNQYLMKGKEPGNPICAFRDYGRRNLVFWLTKDLATRGNNN